MVDQFSVEVNLKGDLEARLKSILPMIEKMDNMFSKMNQTLSVLEMSQKRVSSEFNNMARSVDSVTRKERGLASVNKQVMNVGQAAKGATHQVNTLGGALGNLTKLIAPLLILQKLTQGAGALGAAGLDFQKQATSLQQSNISPAIQQQVISESLKLGSSGKYAMSGSDFIKTFKEIRSVSRNDEDAVKSLSSIGQLDMKFRQIDEKLSGQAAILPRFFEKFAAFDDSGKAAIANDLLKVVQATGGSVTPAQLLQQISTSGTSIVGADPLKEFTEQAYAIKESAAGTGKSGGRGRGGVGRQALDRLMNLGVMTPAMANMMEQAGMLEGIQHAASGKSKGTYISPDGARHSIPSARRTNNSLKTSDVNAYLLKSRPEWMRLHANDSYETALDFAAGADALSGNKIKGSFMQTRAAHLQHFANLPADQQKFFEGRLLAGMKMTGVDFAMERSVGRYKQSHDIFAERINNQPGMRASGSISVEDRWEQLMKQFETFGNALGSNEDIVKLANTAIDNLASWIKTLNDNVAPIATYITSLAPKSIEAGTGAAGGAMLGGAIGGLPGAAIGGFAGGKAGDLSHRIMHEVDKARSSNWGKQLYDWGKKNFAPASYAGGLVPPPPPGVPAQLAPPSGFGAPETHGQGKYFIAPPPGSGVAYNPGLFQQNAGRTNWTDKELNITNNIQMDSKTIAKHTSRHVANESRKAAMAMSYGASTAQGNIAPKVLHSGGGQSH